MNKIDRNLAGMDFAADKRSGQIINCPNFSARQLTVNALAFWAECSIRTNYWLRKIRINYSATRCCVCNLKPAWMNLHGEIKRSSVCHIIKSNPLQSFSSPL